VLSHGFEHDLEEEPGVREELVDEEEVRVGRVEEGREVTRQLFVHSSTAAYLAHKHKLKKKKNV
jgi:hypothetical protein